MNELGVESLGNQIKF